MDRKCLLKLKEVFHEKMKETNGKECRVKFILMFQCSSCMPIPYFFLKPLEVSLSLHNLVKIEKSKNKQEKKFDQRQFFQHH